MNNPNFPPPYFLPEDESTSLPSLRSMRNSLISQYPVLPAGAGIGPIMPIYPLLNVGVPIHYNYQLGWPIRNNVAVASVVGQPSLVNSLGNHSPSINRSTADQQAAAQMMSTASMIPKKIQQSLRRASQPQDEPTPQLQTSRQPDTKNILQQYLQQSQVQHQQLSQTFNHSMSTFQGKSVAQEPDEVFPLRKWIEKEPSGDCQPDNVQKQTGMMLRRTAIAYAIIELIRGARTSSHSSTCYELQQACTIDNFLVRVIKVEDDSESGDKIGHESTGEIKGVQMINPPSSLFFRTPFVSIEEGVSEDGDGMGQYVEADVFPRPILNQAVNPLEKLHKEQSLIHSVGSLIHELYTMGNPILLLYEFQKGPGDTEPPTKKTKQLSEPIGGGDEAFFPLWQQGGSTISRKAKHLSLLELGFSSSLSSSVDQLLDCKCTLDVASRDLHLILLDPNSFLIDRYFKPVEGKVRLRIRKNHLYGRDSESSLITSTFCRVKTSGNSEALLVGGYSGSGKTRLVESVLKYMDGVSCHVISHKSEESSSSVITQALDNLCVSIQEKCSAEECMEINSRLEEAFGSDFSILEKVLPNTKLFNTTKKMKRFAPKHQGSEIESNSISYILRLFVRAVSSKERPIVLFVDDLQWCDNASLEIIGTILSDSSGSSCVYFLGCFRDDEINSESEHPVFQLIENMNTNKIPVQLLRISGVNRNALNCMTSDALCILPRHCKDLSDIIHSKTKGDPYFALEMLNALVDRGLLQFSFSKRRWTWNHANIMYLDVTSDVLHFLKNKMMSMSKQMQTALKVCSCFGVGVGSVLVRHLCDSDEYSTLQNQLNLAVEEGFLEKVGDGYKFVHDRVKEAAYSLLQEHERNRFHFQVGMILLNSSKVDESLVPLIADQVNHGVGESIHSADDCHDISELNYKAGCIAMTHSGFLKAFYYFETAKTLLPQNHWKSHYYYSIRLFLSLSNAAFACGRVNLADEALGEILKEGKSLEDKLDAHYFRNNLLLHRGQAKDAYDRCAEVLRGLGETIPSSFDSVKINDMLKKMFTFLTSISDDSLLNYKECSDRLHFYVMQFYQQLGLFSFFGQSSSMQSYLWCRSVEIAIRVGFCKFTAVSMASVAALLCGATFKDISNGYRLGRVALSLLTRFNATGLIPVVYLSFYGMVAWAGNETIMHCADQLYKGFQIGMSVGQPTIALMNGLHYIQKSFVGGRNLLALSKDIDYQLELSKTHDDSRAKRFMGLFKETLCQIIDKNKARADTTTVSTEGISGALDVALEIEGFAEVVFFHRVIQSYWLGYADRCHYFAQKSTRGDAAVGKLLRLVANFYHGLAALQILRKKKSKVEMKAIAQNALNDLTSASELAPINFKNKAELLQAELHRTDLVLRGNDEERLNAKKMYVRSICSAESAKFEHERALALELAAHFYEENGELANALRNFSEAKMHYELWGSKVRVSQMETAIARTETRIRK